MAARWEFSRLEISARTCFKEDPICVAFFFFIFNNSLSYYMPYSTTSHAQTETKRNLPPKWVRGEFDL